MSQWARHTKRGRERHSKSSTTGRLGNIAVAGQGAGEEVRSASSWNDRKKNSRRQKGRVTWSSTSYIILLAKKPHKLDLNWICWSFYLWLLWGGFVFLCSIPWQKERFSSNWSLQSSSKDTWAIKHVTLTIQQFCLSWHTYCMLSCKDWKRHFSSLSLKTLWLAHKSL